MNWEGSSARHRFTFINSFFMQLTKKTYSFNGNFNHTCHIVLIIIEGAHIHKEKYNWDPSLGLRAIYIYMSASQTIEDTCMYWITCGDFSGRDRNKK